VARSRTRRAQAPCASDDARRCGATRRLQVRQAALDSKSIAAFLKEAVKLNKAKGDPTKR